MVTLQKWFKFMAINKKRFCKEREAMPQPNLYLELSIVWSFAQSVGTRCLYGHLKVDETSKERAKRVSLNNAAAHDSDVLYEVPESWQICCPWSQQLLSSNIVRLLGRVSIKMIFLSFNIILESHCYEPRKAISRICTKHPEDHKHKINNPHCWIQSTN